MQDCVHYLGAYSFVFFSADDSVAFKKLSSLSVSFSGSRTTCRTVCTLYLGACSFSSAHQEGLSPVHWVGRHPFIPSKHALKGLCREMNNFLKTYYDKYVLSAQALIVLQFLVSYLNEKIKNYILILKTLRVTRFKDPKVKQSFIILLLAVGAFCSLQRNVRVLLITYREWKTKKSFLIFCFANGICIGLSDTIPFLRTYFQSNNRWYHFKINPTFGSDEVVKRLPVQSESIKLGGRTVEISHN